MQHFQNLPPAPPPTGAAVAQLVWRLVYGLEGHAGAGNFSLHHRFQTGSGVYPASYPIGTRGSFSEGKATVV